MQNPVTVCALPLTARPTEADGSSAPALLRLIGTGVAPPEVIGMGIPEGSGLAVELARLDFELHNLDLSGDGVERAGVLSRDRRGTDGDIDLSLWAGCIHDEACLFAPGMHAASQPTADGYPAGHSPRSLGALAIRGRLTRNAACSRLTAGRQDDLTQARTGLAAALADLHRAGWLEEHAWSAALFALCSVLAFDDGFAGATGMISESVDRMRLKRSPRLGLAETGLALVRLHEDDIESARDLVADVVSRGVAPERVRTSTLAVQAMIDLVASDGASRDAIETLSEVPFRPDGSILHVAGGAVATVGHLLLDLGCDDAATELLARSRNLTCTDDEPRSVRAAWDHAILDLRIKLRETPDTVDFDDVLGWIARLDESGAARRAALHATRLTGDLDFAGRCDDAAVLRARAAHLSPRRTRPSLFERIASARTAATRGRAAHEVCEAPDPLNQIRLLGSCVEVSVDGATVPLQQGTTRLLAILVLERAIEMSALSRLLWPDADPTDTRTRKRLNLAIHRLRESLGVGTDGLIRRNADHVELVSDTAWRIDVRELRTLAAGTLDDQLAALRMYADISDPQLAYQDAVLEGRDALRSLWISVARRILDSLPELEAEIAGMCLEHAVDTDLVIG